MAEITHREKRKRAGIEKTKRPERKKNKKVNDIKKRPKRKIKRKC